MKFQYDPEFKGIYVCPDCAVEALHLVRDIGIDYDGMDGSIDDMRDLVDELLELVADAIDFIYEGKIFPDEEAEEKSWFKAKEEESKDMSK